MTHYDPQWSKIFTLWATLTQNIVNCFTMTQNKVLNFVSKNFFPVNLVPKLESALFEMKLDTKRYSRLLTLNLAIVFLNFVQKYLFWENLVCKRQSVLFRMKIRTKRYSAVLVPNSTTVFLCSLPKILF